MIQKEMFSKKPPLTQHAKDLSLFSGVPFDEKSSDRIDQAQEYIDKYEALVLEKIPWNINKLPAEKRGAAKRVVSNNEEVSSITKSWSSCANLVFYLSTVIGLATTFIVLKTDLWISLENILHKDLIISLFPNSELWVNSSLVYRHNIYLLYPVYVFIFWSTIFASIYILLKTYSKPHKIMILSRRDYVNFPPKMTRSGILNWILTALTIVMFLFLFYAGVDIYLNGSGYSKEVQAYNDYDIKSSSRSISDATIWNNWLAIGIIQVGFWPSVSILIGAIAIRFIILFPLTTFYFIKDVLEKMLKFRRNK